MESLLTVIIPIYNCKEYIEICVDSIICQCNELVKIILVDDGSSDGSEVLCDNYAKKYSFIQVAHLKNKGVSHARNVGLDMVTTEWVMFADADDAFFNGAFNKIIEFISIYHTSVFFGNDRGVEFNANNVVCGEEISSCFPANTVFGLLTNPAENTVLAKQYEVILFESCWGKVLNYNIISDNKIRFNEQLQISEDAIFII